MTKKAEPVNYAGMWRGTQEEAIDAAKSPQELDAMWAEWERIGHSPEGRIAARITVRRAELTGTPLTAEQRAWITSVKLEELLPTEEA
jgi:hypothetical protein